MRGKFNKKKTALTNDSLLLFYALLKDERSHFNAIVLPLATFGLLLRRARDVKDTFL